MVTPQNSPVARKLNHLSVERLGKIIFPNWPQILNVVLIRSSIYKIAVNYKLVFFLQSMITNLSQFLLREKHFDLVLRKIIISTIVMQIEFKSLFQ